LIFYLISIFQSWWRRLSAFSIILALFVESLRKESSSETILNLNLFDVKSSWICIIFFHSCFHYFKHISCCKETLLSTLHQRFTNYYQLFVKLFVWLFDELLPCFIMDLDKTIVFESVTIRKHLHESDCWR